MLHGRFPVKTGTETLSARREVPAKDPKQGLGAHDSPAKALARLVPRTRQMAVDYLAADAQRPYVMRATAVAKKKDRMVGARRAFSPDEDTALARCWVAASAVHDEQNASDFWARVGAAFCEQPEATETLRTACTLQSRWGILQRLV